MTNRVNEKQQRQQEGENRERTFSGELLDFVQGQIELHEGLELSNLGRDHNDGVLVQVEFLQPRLM